VLLWELLTQERPYNVSEHMMSENGIYNVILMADLAPSVTCPCRILSLLQLFGELGATTYNYQYHSHVLHHLES